MFAACGGDDAGVAADAADCPTEGSYFPMVTGAEWVYRVVDPDVTTKTQTVGDEEDVGGMHAGTMAFKLTTEKPNGMVVSWQGVEGERVVRYAEQDLSGANTTSEEYTPSRTRVDMSEAHTTLNATWTESYTEHVSENGGAVTTSDKSETWTVIGVDESVTVPAGTFCALHLRRQSTVGGIDGSDKSYWFARGVGKVQEVSATRTETLESYDIP